ncbi:MAG: hypothetical protein AAGI48_04565 [Verrucomicrobiota bacterium]
MPIYRGFRLISPDDMRGVTVAGLRVSGKEHRQGKYARRRNWGSGHREESSVHNKGASRTLKLVPWEPQIVDVQEEQEPSSKRWGRILGWLAMGSLGLMWLVIVLDVLARWISSGSSGWEPLLVPSMMIAFLGTHLFGFACDSLTKSSSDWGMRALIGFWVSAGVWLPLGATVSIIRAIFG